MTYVIVHALAPIFVIMLLGFWAGKAKMVDNKNVSALNNAAGSAKSMTKILSRETFLLSTIFALPAQNPSSMMTKIGARA